MTGRRRVYVFALVSASGTAAGNRSKKQETTSGVSDSPIPREVTQKTRESRYVDSYKAKSHHLD